MSLLSSGPISITQIYQECGGLSTTLDQNIANIYKDFKRGKHHKFTRDI